MKNINLKQLIIITSRTGEGKTHLAKIISEKYLAENHDVFWIEPKEIMIFNEEEVTLRKNQGIINLDPDENIVISEFNQNSLIVFDEWQQLPLSKDLIKKLLAKKTNILITSQSLVDFSRLEKKTINLIGDYGDRRRVGHNRFDYLVVANQKLIAEINLEKFEVNWDFQYL